MQHYWGAKEILQRVGLSPNNYRRFAEVRLRYGIPCFPRYKFGHATPMYYASESMIASWELSCAKQDLEKLKAARDAHLDRRYKRSERKRKTNVREADPVGDSSNTSQNGADTNRASAN